VGQVGDMIFVAMERTGPRAEREETGGGASDYGAPELRSRPSAVTASEESTRAGRDARASGDQGR
jgi:hypothetical protein